MNKYENRKNGNEIFICTRFAFEMEAVIQAHEAKEGNLILHFHYYNL